MFYLIARTVAVAYNLNRVIFLLVHFLQPNVCKRYMILWCLHYQQCFHLECWFHLATRKDLKIKSEFFLFYLQSTLRLDLLLVPYSFHIDQWCNWHAINTMFSFLLPTSQLSYHPNQIGGPNLRKRKLFKKKIGKRAKSGRSKAGGRNSGFFKIPKFLFEFIEHRRLWT